MLNCSGFFGDEVAGDNSFRIFPKRGEFAVLLADTADLVGRILMPVPHPETKGVLVFPTVYGHLCVGPSAVGQDDKSDWQAHREGLVFVKGRGARLLPEFRNLEQTDSWAGLRPAMYHVAAICSTGLSSCLGLSGHVTGLPMKRGLSLSSSSGKQKHAEPLFEDNPPRPWWERLNELRR